MAELEEKTDKGFWEDWWGESRTWRYRNIRKYLAVHKKFDKLFKAFLEKGNRKILEIGCAGGTQLVYFNKEFGYEPYGVDYSEEGCRIARENLKLHDISGQIICEDVFDASFEQEFDIVYSMGLIEHFFDPDKIIDKHIELLKPGGILIITIPNFKGSLYYGLIKIRGEETELARTHNLSIMEISKLKKIVRDKVDILKLDYFGPINLCSVLHPNNIGLLLFMHIINEAIGYLTFYLKSRYFSPTIVLIARKPKHKEAKFSSLLLN